MTWAERTYPDMRWTVRALIGDLRLWNQAIDTWQSNSEVTIGFRARQVRHFQFERGLTMAALKEYQV